MRIVNHCATYNEMLDFAEIIFQLEEMEKEKSSSFYWELYFYLKEDIDLTEWYEKMVRDYIQTERPEWVAALTKYYNKYPEEFEELV